ncbi:DUF6875 domain-containing protein [Streptacidiphilus sp. EB129]|uniref:DUF6875 domain-containing protein n=1 Tax=Streptacidiphilus sp. EB129 TaxID=3156262 RepID=UPI00351704BF
MTPATPDGSGATGEGAGAADAGATCPFAGAAAPADAAAAAANAPAADVATAAGAGSAGGGTATAKDGSAGGGTTSAKAGSAGTAGRAEEGGGANGGAAKGGGANGRAANGGGANGGAAKGGAVNGGGAKRAVAKGAAAAPPGHVAVPDGTQAQNAWQMRQMIYGHLQSRAVCAMAELGLADLLTRRPLTAAELAGATGADPDLLQRLLRALTAFGVLRGTRLDRFALTALGATLRSDAPASALPTALLVSGLVSHAWNGLSQVVRSGRPSFAEEFGQDFFGHLDGDPELRAIFDRSQETGLALELESVLGAVDLSEARRLVDVGGGDGAMLTGMLDAHPQLTGVLVDRGAALATARERLAATGLEDRCELVEGDFFGTLPSGGDAYLLRHILHDWDDDSCRKLLSGCCRAMGPEGRLLVIDHLTAPDEEGRRPGPEDRAQANHGAFMDLYMMSLFGGGQERGLSEFDALLRGAGFTVGGVTRLPGGSAIIEARPAVRGAAGRTGGGGARLATPSALAAAFAPDTARQKADAASTAAVTEQKRDTTTRWLEEYTAKPHEELGRKGAVCPFVEPSMKAGSLHMLARNGFAEADTEALVALVRDLVNTFRVTRWRHSNPTLHTLLMVLPDLPESRWSLLDDVQAAVKAEMARDGLMLGQFHPNCAEPAARNARFAVSQSPVPLLALRHMALHDVLFLHNDREMFAEYRVRFGDRYERGAAVDPKFREVYDEAIAKFAVVAAPPPVPVPV